MLKFTVCLILTVAFGLSCLVGLSTVGCSSLKDKDPADLYADAQALFSIASLAASEAHSSGKISDADWETFWLPALARAQSVLDELRASVESGQPLDEQKVLVATLMGVLADIEAHKRRGE